MFCCHLIAALFFFGIIELAISDLEEMECFFNYLEKVHTSPPNHCNMENKLCIATFILKFMLTFQYAKYKATI